MKYLAVIGIIILISCQKKSNNIEIKNEELKNVIRQFYKEACYYSRHSINDTISVFFGKKNNYIEINLESFQILKVEEGFCIGETKLDSLKVFFYIKNEDIESIEDLVKIKYEKKYTPQRIYTEYEMEEGIGYKETYTDFYKYENGRVEKIK